MLTLKDVLIEAGEIDKYFGNTAPVNLWRARKLNKKQIGLFDLVEEDQVRNGNIRPADVTIEDGIVKVKNRPRGASTFDKPDVFNRGNWEYYKIPQNMQLPEGLVIVKDKYNKSLGATHYTIAPKNDMPIQQFRSLLNQLAAKLEVGAA
ncbi:hypothetical protein [Marinibactrum halimedae]|uniref:Tse2 ADP-ribosyltransferase toxin domain-containing protein n=1 Tax=Marinibactrum halimedae TaxID=1444977 RepID=A0AA37WKL9_9GAMM|nr:hypothetical protein [Marinibactrum halimedae]MCD9460660.1 hypothetical protein [Marinibactrum halimedae]GLS24305.1 hypothetical protein GCM10007877_00160 [Marinibactrum halimedae]